MRTRTKEAVPRKVGKRKVDKSESPSHASDSCVRRRDAKNLPLTGVGATRTGVRGRYAETHEWNAVGSRETEESCEDVQNCDCMTVDELGVAVVANLMELNKGEAFGKKRYCWEYTTPCAPQSCCIGDRCKWRGLSKRTPDRICLLRWKYIKEMEAAIVTDYGAKMTQTQFWQLGMHLVPLYQELVSLKIYRASLRTEELFVKGKGGDKIHPVIGLIAQTIKSISSTMREMGLSSGKNLKRIGHSEEMSEAMIAGDPDYYTTLLEEEDEEYEAMDNAGL